VRIFLALVIGILIGVSAVWLYSNRSNPTVQSASDQVEHAVKSASDTIQEKLKVLDLRTNDIKDELARTGQVVRRKTREAGQAISDATADARITAAIKGKLLAHRDLSALSISVNTTGGIVTLSGTVSSMEDISKAMLLAMETDGVHEVISTLQVKPRT
jgi:hyperosmotically inducible periplasmic protein